MEVSFSLYSNYFWTKFINFILKNERYTVRKSKKKSRVHQIEWIRTDWRMDVELKYHGSFYKSLFSLIRSKWGLNLICGCLLAFLLNSQNSSNLSTFVNSRILTLRIEKYIWNFILLFKTFHRSVEKTLFWRGSFKNGHWKR